jgi:hypothetical protein
MANSYSKTSLMKPMFLFGLLVNFVLTIQGLASPSSNSSKEIPKKDTAITAASVEPEIPMAFNHFNSGTQEDVASITPDDNPGAQDSGDHILRDPRKKRIAYIFFNPGAGQGDPEEDLKIIFERLEPEIPVLIFETKEDSLEKQCQELVETIKRRPDSATDCQPIVLASGGDGTVSAVAQAVMNTGIPFGVIPRGTANAFATALQIPTDSIEEACDNILTGTTRLVDAAKVWQTSKRNHDLTSRYWLGGKHGPNGPRTIEEDTWKIGIYLGRCQRNSGPQVLSEPTEN